MQKLQKHTGDIDDSLKKNRSRENSPVAAITPVRSVLLIPVDLNRLISATRLDNN